MDRRIFFVVTLAPLALAGCATPYTGEASEAPLERRMPEGQCDDSPAQAHIGHKASAESGAKLLEITGARTLRWVPPRTAVTMDYRPDRLTVSYDDNYSITRISCG
ncbi:MAG: hypothetical protein IE933_01435 [Sphingomonadales bacterium]|nr:hypothetical protein [Sphingomonadales bacterium]MBD3771980.1 hypothetical protein [Paracoccaceae bacterium]